MTSGNVNNFVSDLVLMAKAMEELPQVKAELEDAKHHFSEASQRIAEREESILRLKQEIDDLHAAKRKVEAERDDAEYRFLESEDRTKQALNFIRSTFGSAGSLIQALEPPAKAEAVAPQAIDNPLYGDPDRYAVEAQPIPQPPAEHEHHYEPMPPQGADASQGQSEPHPTATVETGHGNPTAPVTSSEEVAPAQVDPTPVQEPSPSVQAEGSSSIDDVGYHNEPSAGADWMGWNAWADRMNARYPTGWPSRSAF